MKNENQFIKQLDGLRFLAVAGVMTSHFVHFENIYLQRIPFGYGVNMFFVISGFLITQILLKNKEAITSGELFPGRAIKNFFARRSLRIFPIYYLTILLLYVSHFQNTHDVFGWVVSYTVNIYLSLDKPYIGAFNHLWSLAVEEQFYLIWPFLILFISKSKLPVLIYGTIILSIAFKLILFLIAGWTTAINAFTMSCGDSLGMGALIAYWRIYDKHKLHLVNRNTWLLYSSILLFFVFMVFPRPTPIISMIFGNTLFSLFAFFVVSKASEDNFSGTMKLLLENKIAQHFGKISYGIYLYHFFTPDLYNYMVDQYPPLGNVDTGKVFIFMFLSVVIAEFSWVLVEKPLVALKSKFC